MLPPHSISQGMGKIGEISGQYITQMVSNLIFHGVYFQLKFYDLDFHCLYYSQHFQVLQEETVKLCVQLCGYFLI